MKKKDSKTRILKKVKRTDATKNSIPYVILRYLEYLKVHQEINTFKMVPVRE